MQPLRLDAWGALVAPRPLAVIDLETTDAKVDDCGIVEFGAVGYSSGKVLAAAAAAQQYLASIAAGAPNTGVLPMPEPDWRYPVRINPGRPIAPGATAVHGITDEMVAGCPGAEALTGALQTIADGYTVATYNGIKFDLRILARLCGFTPKWSIDVMGVWAGAQDQPDPAWFPEGEGPDPDPAQGRRPGPRVVGDPIFRLGRDVYRDSLGAAHGALLGRRLVGAHGALADCEGTARVLFALVALYATLPADPDQLGTFAADVVAFVRRNPEGRPYFTRGRHEGTLVADVRLIDESYIGWALTAEDIMPAEKALIVDAVGQTVADQLVAKQQAKNAGGRGGRGRRATAAATA